MIKNKINQGIDNATKDLIAATNPERARQVHKSLLTEISWTAKKELDHQLERMAQ